MVLMIRKFVEAEREGHEEVVIWGSGKASREFLYVEDAAYAILEMAEKGTESGPFNLGTGKEHTIVELIEEIAKATMSKLKEHIGYCPTTSLSAGINTTVDWFKRFYEPEPNKLWVENGK